MKKLPQDATVGVVGLGYVGLPLLLAYAKAGYAALGFDVDATKETAIRARKTYIKHIPDSELQAASENGKLDATTDFLRVSECDALILCVPTPLDEHFEPDLSYVVATIESILPGLRAGQVVSLESTT